MTKSKKQSYLSKKNLIIALVIAVLVLGSVLTIVLINNGTSNNIITLSPVGSPVDPPIKTLPPVTSPPVTSPPVTSPPTPKPVNYILQNGNFKSATTRTVKWPDTLINTIKVNFKFKYTEIPISNATILDCQNQSKLYAGWKIYFRGTAKTLVLQLGTMSNGQSGNQYIYSYKSLELNKTYDINLALDMNSVVFEIDQSGVSLTDFDNSLPILWDPVIYIGHDNQYTNRAFVNNKFRISNLNISV